MFRSFRPLIAGAIALGSTYVLTDCASPPTKIYKVDPTSPLTQSFQHAQTFPTNILGAGRVDVMPVAGAIATLVHIRWLHRARQDVDPTDPLNIYGNDAVQAHVSAFDRSIRDQRERCDKDIDSIVRTLSSNGVSSVHFEPCIAEDWGTTNTWLQQARIVYNAYQGATNIATSGLTQKQESYLKTLPSRVTDMYGCIARKYIEHRLDLRPANRDAAIAKADAQESAALQAYANGGRGSLAALSFRSSSGFLDAAFQDREDDFIDYIMTESGERSCNGTSHPLHVVVYGAMHDFRDNVSQWNKEHPKKRLSLIELTPSAICPTPRQLSLPSKEKYQSAKHSE